MTTAIILAAGKSERMGGGVDKAFISLVDKPVVAWSLLAFERCADIDRIVLVVRKDQLIASKAVVKMFGISKLDKIVAGGNKRPWIRWRWTRQRFRWCQWLECQQDDRCQLQL